jgi:hypothetical protein
MIHKFRIGQKVCYAGSRGNFRILPGVHVISGELPERNGEFEYQVTCVVRESELIGATYGSEITPISDKPVGPAMTLPASI